jgi:hypothetical protein
MRSSLFNEVARGDSKNNLEALLLHYSLTFFWEFLQLILFLMIRENFLVLIKINIKVVAKIFLIKVKFILIFRWFHWVQSSTQLDAVGLYCSQCSRQLEWNILPSFTLADSRHRFSTPAALA